MIALVAGGAGFIGSHLCEALLSQSHQVLCVDNYLSGLPDNVSHLRQRAGFQLIEHDLIQPLPEDWPVDAVFNLASPASPPYYLAHPIETARVNAQGTYHLLELARHHGARYLQASTSEVYGDPLVHPQPESYWGNVNPNGIRSCYDEGKRFAESLVMDYCRLGLDARIIRIFNTYGPRNRADDGRVVPNFIDRALRRLPLPVHGDGSQTRSFCYVEDLVRGMLAAQLHDGTRGEVFNLGNPGEFTMLELAELVQRLTGDASGVEFQPAREDDPSRRRPDITKATAKLGWTPRVNLEEGLRRTIAWFREHGA
ncbi:MAG TPA: UDP-glucuronic acid decarboxylase family protein [Chloroflexota bacterium]|nr:UDP-glucuronic acid decarboxylase family protein [Chloroflexota bacterium]